MHDPRRPGSGRSSPATQGSSAGSVPFALDYVADGTASQRPGYATQRTQPPPQRRGEPGAPPPAVHDADPRGYRAHKSAMPPARGGGFERPHELAPAAAAAHDAHDPRGYRAHKSAMPPARVGGGRPGAEAPSLPAAGPRPRGAAATPYHRAREDTADSARHEVAAHLPAAAAVAGYRSFKSGMPPARVGGARAHLNPAPADATAVQVRAPSPAAAQQRRAPSPAHQNHLPSASAAQAPGYRAHKSAMPPARAGGARTRLGARTEGFGGAGIGGLSEDGGGGEAMRQLLAGARASGELALPNRGLVEFPRAVIASDEDIGEGERVWEFVELRKLDLSHNAIEAVPDEIAVLGGSLLVLSLRRNSLAALPEGFYGLEALVKLDLSGNRLTALGPGVARLASLAELDVSGNSLSRLPDAIVALRTLALLDCSKNSLRALPDGLAGLVGLRKLALNENALEHLDQGCFDGLGKLHTLELASNRLMALPRYVRR